jgi:paraquat-inducible protein A
MQEVADVMVCEGCDAAYRRTRPGRHEILSCPRCGTELDRDWGTLHTYILPLSAACLILFAIANLFPIVEIKVRGLHSETTLVGALLTLTQEGRSSVALLVLATTLVFPLAQLAILLYLSVPLVDRRKPAGFNILVRLMQSLRPWGMIEVFLLGVLVAIVKLSGLARVIPGAALWAFMGLTVLLTVVLSFNPRAFWQLVFNADQERAP